MDAPSIDIVAILTDESSIDSNADLGLTFAVNLFVGREPTKPDLCVTIFDTHGLPTGMSLDSVGFDHPSVQIRVRAKDYQTGWALIEGIKSSLHGRANETWNGTYYSVIYCTSGPALLDWDDNGRCRFIVNFNINRRN